MYISLFHVSVGGYVCWYPRGKEEGEEEEEKRVGEKEIK